MLTVVPRRNRVQGAVNPNLLPQISDPYFSNVVLLMHMDGANNSNIFTDVKGKTVTTNGDVKISTAQKKFGSSSAYFNGSNSCLSMPNTDFLMGTLDFTIEFFYQHIATTNEFSRIIQQIPGDVYSGYNIYFDQSSAQLIASFGSTGTNFNIGSIAIGSVSTTQFDHFEITRSGSTFYFFKNGSIVNSLVNSLGLHNGAGNLVIGGQSVGINRTINGYLDELRITRGIARNIANFNVPSYSFPDR